MCNINHPKFPCRICAKNAHGKDKAVQCDLCEPWIHIKCNKLNKLSRYRYLQNCDEFWYCIDCCSTTFSFNSFQTTKSSWLIVQTLITTSHWRDLEHDHDNSLSLKPSNLELLVNQFKSATPGNSNDPEKISLSKYCDIDKMRNIEIPHKNKSISLFHINECSLNKNFDDL